MKTTMTNEEMIATVLEENSKLGKTLMKEITKLTEGITQLKSENAAILEKASNSSTSIVTWEDHQNALKASEEKQMEYAKTMLILKNKCDKLEEEKRNWATQQWAKHFFRWLFLKRHLGVWAVFMMFLFSMGISVFINLEQRDKIKILQTNDIKYRYIRSTGLIPQILQLLDDSFEDADTERLNIIISSIREYEQALRMKSDSIVRAERKKTKDLR